MHISKMSAFEIKQHQKLFDHWILGRLHIAWVYQMTEILPLDIFFWKIGCLIQQENSELSKISIELKRKYCDIDF